MLQHKFHCKRFFFSLSLNTPHTYCCCTSSIVKVFFSLSLNIPHTCYCTSSIAKDFFFFFSFSKHTTHIHLKSSTPSTLKPQRHKHIKIQNKTFFSSNSAGCYSSIQSIVQQYKIFFSLSTSIPSGLNALSLLFNFSTFLLWKA
jgi:hypothetical protein